MSDNVILATRDAVLATQTRDLGAWVTGDRGGEWEVLGPIDDRRVFGRSRRTGMVIVAVKTGEKVTRGQVRVRIDFPHDLGDVAGTLSFNESHTGGVAPARLFA
jgi:hypothetical protein